MNDIKLQLANSAEAQADVAGTYAVMGAAEQLDAQPQSTFQLLNFDDVPAQVTTAPSQEAFNAFAHAMSTSYCVSIQLFSVDPAFNTKTVLADTSVTNLLAELPVLETQANGVTLGLQLADGAPQVQFASTAGLATFLYAVAVQQGQATSFVTDNYNLDMQWLNTVDQPLLQEAVFCTERAQGETAAGQTERAIEDTTQASMALQIAAEAPGMRQDMSMTINNAATGNPTQITVYADGDGSTIHDVAPSAFSYVESAVSSADLAQTLAPYIGITGQSALACIQADPLTLSNAQVTNLDEAFWAYEGSQLAAQFNSSETYGPGFTFGMLPSNTQLWTQITTGDWAAAANNIATWAPTAVIRNQAMGKLIMQDLNADLLPTPGH